MTKPAKIAIAAVLVGAVLLFALNRHPTRRAFEAANIPLKPIELGDTAWTGRQLKAEMSDAYEFPLENLLKARKVLADCGYEKTGWDRVAYPEHLSADCEMFASSKPVVPFLPWRRAWMVSYEDVIRIYFEPGI